MEQEKPLHPLAIDESGDEYGVRPESSEEEREAKESANIASEYGAAIRGIKYARENNDGVLELNFLAILREEAKNGLHHLVFVADGHGNMTRADSVNDIVKKVEEFKGPKFRKP